MAAKSGGLKRKRNKAMTTLSDAKMPSLKDKILAEENEMKARLAEEEKSKVEASKQPNKKKK